MHRLEFEAKCGHGCMDGCARDAGTALSTVIMLARMMQIDVCMNKHEYTILIEIGRWKECGGVGAVSSAVHVR